MKRAGEKTYLFDNPRNIKRLLYGLYLCCALLFALDFMIHRHSEHPWEWLWGFYPLYGFVGCVVLVLVAKWMRRIVMRAPDYYHHKRGRSHLIRPRDELNDSDPFYAPLDKGGDHEP